MPVQREGILNTYVYGRSVRASVTDDAIKLYNCYEEGSCVGLQLPTQRMWIEVSGAVLNLHNMPSMEQFMGAMLL